MAKDKGTKVSMEEEVNNLKKYFDGIVATMKDLKETTEGDCFIRKIMVSRRFWKSKM